MIQSFFFITFPLSQEIITLLNIYLNFYFPSAANLKMFEINTFYFQKEVLLLFLYNSYGTLEFPDCANLVIGKPKVGPYETKHKGCGSKNEAA